MHPMSPNWIEIVNKAYDLYTYVLWFCRNMCGRMVNLIRVRLLRTIEDALLIRLPTKAYSVSTD
jgi:hypothetical protein